LNIWLSKLPVARRTGKTCSFADGKAESIVEGQREKSIEVARNLLTDGFIPVLAAKITGLSLDEEQALSNC
jgi:hypothetical protein